MTAEMELPLVLVLTPVRDAAAHLARYAELLRRLDYPRERLSLGMLEGDSTDGTFELLPAVGELLPGLRRFQAWKHDFGAAAETSPLAGAGRWAAHLQLERRAILARARNRLLQRALADEDWVLWLDVDLADYPADILRRLLAVGEPIVQPHCVGPDGNTFDTNAWQLTPRGPLILDRLRGREVVTLHGVGAAMLLVRADLHREGLVFPPFLYGRRSRYIRAVNPFVGPDGQGEIESEGFGVMAHDMGTTPVGLPGLRIVHAG